MTLNTIEMTAAITNANTLTRLEDVQDGVFDHLCWKARVGGEEIKLSVTLFQGTWHTINVDGTEYMQVEDAIEAHPHLAAQLTEISDAVAEDYE